MKNPASTNTGIRIITEDTIQNAFLQQELVTSYRCLCSSFTAQRNITMEYISEMLDIPISLCFALSCLDNEQDSALDSIPFFSLLHGFFLPLNNMTSVQVERLFGVCWQKTSLSHEEIIEKFLNKDAGLSIVEKICFLTGDPFSGTPSPIGQDTLLNILSTLQFTSIQKLQNTLIQLEDISILAIQHCTKIRSSPPISSKEIMIILRHIPFVTTNIRKHILRDIFARCGRLERYFLVRLLLHSLNFSYKYYVKTITHVLAKQYDLSPSTIYNTIVMGSIFNMAKVLDKDGSKDLKKMVIRTLIHPT